MKFRYQITNLSVTHNAIADWLIANPGKGQNAKCAAHFNISESWLSTLKQSDAFQALLKSKQEDVFEEVIIPLEEKIAGVAHASVEKLGEMLQETNDGRLVKDIFDSALDKMGYGAKHARAAGGAPLVQNNTLIVSDPAALAEARARASQHYGRQIEGTSEPAEPDEVPSATQLPSHQGTQVGEARELRSEVVNPGEEVPRGAAEGSTV
jgi:hypothetical protein